tara:strand:+ start:2075 stop:2209 length:135 start_codon:yes stop_codon:yes gene_type:complete
MRYKIKDKQLVIDWFNNFADFVQEYDDNIYDLACEWADDQECEF